MEQGGIRNVLVELRLNAWVARPSNARLALSLFETREAIQQTQAMIERSDRLIASLSMVLCCQSAPTDIKPPKRVPGWARRRS